MLRPRFSRFLPLFRRCRGSARAEQLVLIFCAVLAVGLVASVILRYGADAWLPLGAGLAVWVVLMAAAIYWNERRNRLARLREEERRRAAGEKPAAANRGSRKGSDARRG
jgi:type IV secretory pathway TrbD component